MNNVLLKPLLTEKSTKDAAQGKFTFEVVPSATKHQIAEAVEHIFGVNVKRVWTVRIAGKTRRFGRVQRKLSDRKKAVVKLTDGQTIDLFATEKSAKVGSALGRKGRKK